MSTPQNVEKERVVATLVAHVYQGVDPYRGMGEGTGPAFALCTCGWEVEVPDHTDDAPLWAAHVAEELDSRSPSEQTTMPDVEKDEPDWTPTEALEHIVMTLERGESVPFWTVVKARRALSSTSEDQAGGDRD